MAQKTLGLLHTLLQLRSCGAIFLMMKRYGLTPVFALPEESADEHDPIVEFAPEPDAETEPRASHDGLPLAEFPHC